MSSLVTNWFARFRLLLACYLYEYIFIYIGTSIGIPSMAAQQSTAKHSTAEERGFRRVKKLTSKNSLAEFPRLRRKKIYIRLRYDVTHI